MTNDETVRRLAHLAGLGDLGAAEKLVAALRHGAMPEHVTDWKARAEMLEAKCRAADERASAAERDAGLLRIEVDKGRTARAEVEKIHKELVDALKKAGVVA